MARLGLYGGSFDPVHGAHVALARVALDHLQLDRLHWVPAGQPWQKAGQAMAPAEDRAAMVGLAIAGEPRWVLDRSEIDRPGPSYTLDTLAALQAATPAAEWFLVLGQDQHARLATWHGWRELLQRATLAVAARPGEPTAAPSALAGTPHRTVWLPLAPMDISATAIRARLAAGAPAAALEAGMVPPAVARYIDRHGLYRSPSGGLPPAPVGEPSG